MLTAGLPWPSMVWVIFIDWVMIITGLIGALTPTRWKWGKHPPTPAFYRANNPPRLVDLRHSCDVLHFLDLGRRRPQARPPPR